MSKSIVEDAVERLRRISDGERMRSVYGFDDEEMDDFMCRMLENKHTADLQRVAKEYMLTVPTLLKTSERLLELVEHPHFIDDNLDAIDEARMAIGVVRAVLKGE